MTSRQLLAGKRILITRAHHQSGRLAEALQAQGASVLRLPTIEIVPPETYAPLDAALEAIRGFDWLILTSANGVSALADRMQFLNIMSEHLRHLQIAAIGPATASAVERLGLKVSTMPEEYVAEAVVALLREKVPGRKVLLARAAVARDVIPEELRKCGADIHVVEAYRTVIPMDSIARLRAMWAPGEPLPDAVTFTSSSTVNNFFSLLAAAKLDLPEGLKAVSIGPVTSRTLRGQGWEPACQAVQYDIPGVVAACVALLRDA
ncbi:MAG TPA: uroporphyrinogen-III synthase [Acidobacteriaceae bacterium]|nr:uroporphyrinogen-III synthase [Acidobacteriaceae bacterium]